MDQAYKSVLAGGEDREEDVAAVDIPLALQKFPVKFWWFASRPEPYMPHTWQTLFHAADFGGQLRRYRHLVAGRRGGKTLSAAWETLFYALHPSEYHRDFHGRESDRPLWIWALSKDYQAGRPSLRTFIEVLNAAGLYKDKDYTFNKAQQVFEFNSGTTIEFKTASDPQSLRGAGLDILWIDEAAFIPNKDAWSVVRSALGDKPGALITTTTPWGENWFYEEFFVGGALGDPRQFRVEYTSIDNPYYPKEEWDYNREHMPPVLFAREHLASFKAMHGVALNGDWLQYWVHGNPDTRTDTISIPRSEDKRYYDLNMFIGVDPAISIADDADDFAMAVIGVTKDGTQAFLVDYFLGHIPFPEQVEKIAMWHQKWRPQMIGVESNAFQRALEQQAARLPGMPPVVPVFAKGKKEERILAMAPMFKIGKVRINEKHGDFITQWVSFDPEQKNQRDDLLDAVEIAMGVAGILLPSNPHVNLVQTDNSLEAHAAQYIQQIRNAQRPADPDLGEMA